jgi:hypothetical protein
MSLPYLFVFDLDHTLIGNSEYFYYFDDFKNFINKSQKLGIINYTQEELDKLNNYNYFKSHPNMYRNGAIEFIKYLKKTYKNAEFFIYSMALTEHILEYIKELESRTDIKFNKPYFNRIEHCYYNGYYYKDFNLIIDDIKKSLGKKYNGLNKINNNKLINNNLIFFDDRNDHIYNNNFINRVVTFPKYEYLDFVNLNNFVPDRLCNDININKYFKVLTINSGSNVAFYYINKTDNNIINAPQTFTNVNINNNGNISVYNNYNKYDVNNNDNNNNINNYKPSQLNLFKSYKTYKNILFNNIFDINKINKDKSNKDKIKKKFNKILDYKFKYETWYNYRMKNVNEFNENLNDDVFNKYLKIIKNKNMNIKYIFSDKFIRKMNKLSL